VHALVELMVGLEGAGGYLEVVGMLILRRESVRGAVVECQLRVFENRDQLHL
jgi:hypothetical protein